MSTLICNPDRVTRYRLSKQFDTTLVEGVGVYAFDSCGMILYIGCSSAVHSRINAHFALGKIKAFVNDDSKSITVRIKYCKDIEQARAVERRMIKKYNPVMNKQYNDRQAFRMAHEILLTQ